MTKQELSGYDGKDGRPAYVAYKGKVYDVTKSERWSGGFHMNRHHAGADMTDVLSQAPHGEEMLARMPVVGALDGGAPSLADPKTALRMLYRRYHPHPVSIHFPIALYFFAALMQGAYIVSEMNHAFDLAALYALVVATAMLPAAAGAGMLSWWINYGMKPTAIFKIKIAFTLIAFALGCAALALRFGGGSAAAYNVCVFGAVPAVFFVAHNGGKLTWPEA